MATYNGANSKSLELERSIVITGPESTGKSVLAQALSERLKLPLVSELARDYLNKLERPYTLEDVLQMAQNQWNAIQTQTAIGPCVIDTDLTVFKIWIAEKYGQSVPWIEQVLATTTADRLYLLCDIDIAWQDDPLREHPSIVDRRRLFDLYRKYLESNNCTFYVINGLGEQRLNNALEALGSEL